MYLSGKIRQESYNARYQFIKSIFAINAIYYVITFTNRKQFCLRSIDAELLDTKWQKFDNSVLSKSEANNT